MNASDYPAYDPVAPVNKIPLWGYAIIALVVLGSAEFVAQLGAMSLLYLF